MRDLAIGVFAFCGALTALQAQVPVANETGTSIPGYIVPDDSTNLWIRSANTIGGYDDGACWTPSAAQVIEAEKAVRDYIASAALNPKAAFPKQTDTALDLSRRQLAEIVSNYSKYEVQFGGILVGGHRQIFCNYFRRDVLPPADPHQDFVFRAGGGSSFWRVRYSLDNRTCQNLDIADEALTKVEGAKFTGYLASGAEAAGWMEESNTPAVVGQKSWYDEQRFWVPSSAEAIRAEAAVHRFIRKSQTNLHLAFPEIVDDPKLGPESIKWCKTNLKNIDDHYSEMGIQFVGLYVNGRKEIYCNYYPLAEKEIADMASIRLLIVSDGGFWFWQVVVDPKTGKCSHLQINGEA